MIDEDRLNKCMIAAEFLYKNFCDPTKGFYSGVVRNRETGKPIHIFNRMPGAQKVIEDKLHRKLNKYEITVLSVAVGEGETPIMSDEERKDAFEYMFPRGKQEYQKQFVALDKLLAGI